MKKINCFCFLLFLVLFTQISFAQDAYPRQDFLDVEHYSFSLKLQDETNAIQGKTTIKINFKEVKEEFFLDFISEKSGKGMTVSEVLCESEKCDFRQENDRLYITIPSSLASQKQLSFDIEYDGVPKDGLIISKNKYGNRTFFGDNWPDRARNWLPSIDHPHDKATCEFKVLAPSKYQVIANGSLVEESDVEEGYRYTHWKTEVPLPTKVMVIGVGEFAVQYLLDEDILLSSWVYPEDREKGFYDYAQAEEIVAFLESIIAEYPYTKLANVQSKTRYGGMENAGNIFYDENTVTGLRAFEALLAHEIVHQWFGNSASEADWHHIWLSEGFATYFTNYYYEKKYGVEKFQERMQADRRRIIQFAERHPNRTLVIDTNITDYNQLLTPNVYEKGGWLLHMLRYLLGEEDFMEGVRKYYEQYQYSNALSDDLKEIFEEVSGKELDWFFEQWLYQPAYPEYSMTWEYQNAEVLLTIEQKQADTFFEQPLEIAFYYEGNQEPQIEVYQPTQKLETLSIPSTEKPIKVVMDPNTWILADIDSQERE